MMKAPDAFSQVVCPDLEPAVDSVSPVSRPPAVLDEGQRSRYGSLIKPLARD